MNQDSEQNEPRRDGEPRSFGRRDDGRDRNGTGAGQPRFNRSRTDDSAKPKDTKFERRDRDDRPSGAPRFNRESNDRRSQDERPAGPPRFGRDNDSRNSDSRNGSSPNGSSRPNDRNTGDRRRETGGAGSRPERFDRPSNDRPRFNKDSNSRDTNRSDERPRFDRERTDNRFSRDERPSRPARSDEERSRPTSRPGDDTPRRPTNRDEEGRRTRSNREERPRFERTGTERPERGRPTRDNNRPDGAPRFNREGGPRDNARKGQFDKPSRFSRDGGSSKPTFKRVGGFNREADERNRFGNDDQRGSDRRDRGSREDDRPAGESRFSGQQRKDSSDRRTGNFTKAPNYNLEQARENAYPRRERTDERRGERKGENGTTKRGASNDRNEGPRNDTPRNEGPRHEGTRNDGLTRLNRYIANSGVCSRREADELIAQGDISVNGKIVTEMGYKVKEGDTVKYGTKVLNPERFVYVLLNKPKDYITTTEDPEERKTVMELVADAGNFRMYPVGRLDRNTTGLLLLTNDGELADKLTHPSNNIRKIYQVELDKPITDEHFEAIKKGIELEDGPIKPDALSIVTPDAYVVGIEIHSGRNRIVRRMFENFGYEVTKLDRTTFAGLTKKELPRGKWRFLDPKEVIKLKYFNS
ncbi:pseudouridine synthase [Spirosoma sp. KCTC 42546]|uniref:pseudouridine synthase n=1 Tax=Spirosoma sp. KCTC 42546 TaxID=2520506 RepID=UPI0011575FFC|nr:pseudouridine synthase [Spirosoma sp. KCTC 42546]QDK78080.1 pseudouridine synthase [Spirosoma sp. KCTC 42546]